MVSLGSANVSEAPRASEALEEGVSVRGRGVVISGGTTGIGRATAILLAAQGARVFVFGRHEAELTDALAEIERAGAAGGGEAHGILADQADLAQVQGVFREADVRIGGCDILINNAAVAAGSVTESDLQDIRYVVEANLTGYMACAHEAIARMMRRRDGASNSDGFVGHIVNVGSMSADQREPESEIYVATKAGIQAFSESLRKTANEKGIRVTLIEPGAVATPIQEKTPEQERKKLRAMEMLLPQDIARCVLFCLTQPQRVDVVSIQVRPLRQFI